MSKIRGVSILAAALGVLAFLVYRAEQAGLLGTFGVYDLREYWTAATLYARGINPYDVGEFVEAQRPIRAQHEATIFMWNPPIIFPFIVWTGLLAFPVAVAAWLALNVGAATFGILAARRDEIRSIEFIAAVLSFFPLMLALSYGQITPLILAAFSAFLILSERGDPRSRFLAGAALSITFIKPHLLFLLYLSLALDALRHRRGEILLGLGAGTLALVGAAWLGNPLSIWGYFDRAAAPPFQFMTPSAGSLLQSIVVGGVGGALTPIVRWAPAVITTCIFLARGRAIDPTRGAGVLFLTAVSFFSNPYGWAYDWVVLLPSVLRLEGPGAVFATRAFIGLNAAVLLFLMMSGPEPGQETLWWYPPAMAVVGYRALRSATRAA